MAAEAETITILTQPVTPGALPRVRQWMLRTRRSAKRAVLAACGLDNPDWHRSQYGGPPAVTRSLIEGLISLGVRFNSNPRHKRDVGHIVAVLSSLDALAEALQWKRTGQIRRLLAGPNLVVMPSDERSLMTSPLIDVCLVPGDWTFRCYGADCPELTDRLAVWPAGVDVGFWKPDRPARHRPDTLVYRKSGPAELIDECVASLRNSGHRVVELAYGRYGPEQYRRQLRRSRLAVFFSESESQGIALAEAWAMDVPTLVWSRGYALCSGQKIAASSAPYLGDPTGLFFRGRDDFQSALRQASSTISTFAPRRWVLENMTDEVSAKCFCAIAFADRSHAGGVEEEIVRDGESQRHHCNV